jgi:putative restriction endonuclease
MSNASKLDKTVWDEFYHNWDDALMESEQLLAAKKHTVIEQLNGLETTVEKAGLDKERWIKTRVGQSLFRKMVLAAYDYKCCITGIDETDLLIASHIVPWSKDEANRLRPSNGLCLNALHDRAFDKGLITVSAEDYTILISSLLMKKGGLKSIADNFTNYKGLMIRLPDKAMPSKEQLKKHNDWFKG